MPRLDHYRLCRITTKHAFLLQLHTHTSTTADAYLPRGCSHLAAKISTCYSSIKISSNVNDFVDIHNCSAVQIKL